jgi:hypothetical protein
MEEIPKSGVLIDICPGCKGVWLDRGELGKLLENAREYYDEYEDYYKKHHREPFYDSHKHKYKHKHKKPTWLKILEEIFD